MLYLASVAAARGCGGRATWLAIGGIAAGIATAEALVLGIDVPRWLSVVWISWVPQPPSSTTVPQDAASNTARIVEE
jgi:hypothetical protein